MAQEPCSQNLYPSPAGLMKFSTNQFLIVANIHVLGDETLADTGKGFIPIMGMGFDSANNIYYPLPIAEQTTYYLIFEQFFNECYTASVNFVIGAAGSSLVSQYFASYLYKLLNANPSNMTRFQSIYSTICNFWKNADAAWTSLELTQALNVLYQTLSNMILDCFIPNAAYNFVAASDFATTYAAWLAADSNLVGFQGLEMYS